MVAKVASSVMTTPVPVLPEITLRAAGFAPPTVVCFVPLTCTANEVADDVVPDCRRISADRNAVACVSRDHVSLSHSAVAADHVTRSIVDLHTGRTLVSDHRGAIDAESDVVASHDIQRRVGVLDLHAVLAIARDHVVGAVALVLADGVARRANIDQHAILAVAQGSEAGDVRANQVAGHCIPEGAIVVEVDAVERIAGDQVALGTVHAADRIVSRAAGELDSIAAVGERDRPGNVGPDNVPADRVPLRGTENVDAIAGVARNQVAGPCDVAADDVIRGIRNADAVVGVGSGNRARYIDADEAVLNLVGPTSGDENAAAIKNSGCPAS
jgi:hypothetical protein